MPEIIVSEMMDATVVDEMRSWAEVVYGPELGDDVADLLAEADALIVRNATHVDEHLLDCGPRLRVVGRLGTGVDNIDVAACTQRHIEVCTAAGANAIAVSEYVIGAMLCLLRPALNSTRSVVEGRWPRMAMVGGELSGRRLGVVGYGAIGRALAQRASHLGMTVAAADPHVRSADVPIVPLGDLAARSDVLTIHVPLTPSTIGLIGSEILDLLGPGGLVVDASRGGVVDHAAVLERLRDRRLGGAALDVFTTEPVDADLGGRYRDVPNLLLTPHVAGLTTESNLRVSRTVATAVRRVLAS